MAKPNCQHAIVEEIRSEGGDLMIYQCTLCLSVVKPCGVCNQPLTFRHKERSEGCTKCGKGKFCNAQQPLCKLCGPVQDGYCASPECRAPFPRTGRQEKLGKAYCDNVCRRRAMYLRKQARTAALPVATAEVEA